MSYRKARVPIAILAAAAVAVAVGASPSFARFAQSRTSAGGGGGSNTNCTGTQSKNVSGNLVVPSGATCTVLAVNIGNSIIVNSNATLIDKGANVANHIQASSPKGIGIGGSPTGSAGSVAQGISISGTNGAGPGTVVPNSNYLCNTNIGQSVSISGSLSTAGDWIIGDTDEDCSNGGNQMIANLAVTNNQDRVDVSDNRKGTSPPYMVGIEQSLYVAGNTVTSTSPVVESNFVGQSATCQAGTKKDGDGTPNIVEQSNQGCP